MSGLAVGVCSIALTKRRRFLWCAWWTAEPTAEPFRPPDAWSGGARSEEEAHAAAEQAVGVPLRRVEGRWARAWMRVQQGLPPWPARAPKPSGAAPTEPGRAEPPASAHAILGVPRGATVEEIKRAFRKLALTTHPDHGGATEAFLRVKRAYDAALRKAAKRR